MSEKILVPIKIEALVVDKVTASDTAYNWKKLSIDYEGLGTRLGNFMEPGDLKELKRGGLCEKGIHLHWALPAALTNGIHKDNKMQFPAVPNRWLVIRTHLEKEKPVLKKWIVESDFIGPLKSDKSTWALQQADGSFSTAHNIGKVTELDKWTAEQPRSETPLTAIGPGNATFAAIYQQCRNVFGFWDDLSGLVNTPTVFSYLVTGWYSDPAIEPLLHADKAIIDNLKQRWVLDGLQDAADFPSSILCHGFMHSVAWNPAQAYQLPVKNAAVNTGVGLTSIEAKAVQLSRQTGAAEKLLSSYVYDALKDTVDSTQLEDVVDSRSFTAYDGGVLWEIKRVERDAKTQKDKQADLPNFPSPVENPGLSLAFKKLNEAQQLADKLRRDMKSLMLEFRALCDKIIMAQQSDTAEQWEAKLTNGRDLLKNDIDVIKAAIAQQDTIVTQQQQTIAGMRAFMASANKEAAFELVQKKMPRFWQPTDPTVLFSGPGVVDSDKYKSPGNTASLPCRIKAAIISGIIINDGDTATGKTIQPADTQLDLPSIGSLQPNIAVITQLYKEAILLDPNWASAWGKQYYKDAPGNTINAQKLGEYLRNVLLLTAGASIEKIKGLLRSNAATINNAAWTIDTVAQLLTKWGMQAWAHPWTPLYLIWYVKFRPSYAMETGQWAFKQNDWEWKDKQYQYKGPKPDSKQAIEYSGKVLVSDLITDLLQKRLPEGMDVGQHLSQALDSFSEALLMRRQSIQVPLLQDPAANNDVLKPDKSFDNYLTKEAYFLPDVNAQSDGAPNFFPLRAGHLQFTRLWLTDTFGQVQKVVDSDTMGNVVQNSGLQIAEDLATAQDGSLVTLSPRLVQPARLSFRWHSANTRQREDSSNDPATTPVCGWLLPDCLDQALDIYEAAGKKCGSLKMITVSSRVQLQWQNPPGESNASGPQERITNPYLLGFVNGLLNFTDNGSLAGGEALRHLFDVCNTTALFLTAASSKQTPGIAGLMGQPLALVRASLQLELLGLPAQPQGFEHSITEAAKIHPPGLSQLSFPVTLGDSRNNKDGLIGYFMDKGSKGFETMHLAFGMDKPNHAYFTNSDVLLTLNAAAPPAGITLLVDPRGGVQADAGILPPKLIDLAYPYINEGMKQMELDILVAPFLGSLTDLFIPVGAEPDRQWVLKQRRKDGTWQQTLLDGQTPLQTGALNTQVVQEGYLSLVPLPPDNKQN